MKRLIVSPTDFTPSLDLNPAKLTLDIKGVSRPENVGLFYQQVIDWIDELKSEPVVQEKSTVKVTFKLDYCNSASQKYILILLENLLKLKNKGYQFEINWHYDTGDEKMLEDGEDIADALGFNFNYYTF